MCFSVSLIYQSLRSYGQFVLVFPALHAIILFYLTGNLERQLQALKKEEKVRDLLAFLWPSTSKSSQIWVNLVLSNPDQGCFSKVGSGSMSTSPGSAPPPPLDNMSSFIYRRWVGGRISVGHTQGGGDYIHRHLKFLYQGGFAHHFLEGKGNLNPFAHREGRCTPLPPLFLPFTQNYLEAPIPENSWPCKPFYCGCPFE